MKFHYFCSNVAFCSKLFATLFMVVLYRKGVVYKVVSKNIFFFIYSVASVALLLTPNFNILTYPLFFNIYTLRTCYKCYIYTKLVFIICLLGFFGSSFCYSFATSCYSFKKEVVYV